MGKHTKPPVGLRPIRLFFEDRATAQNAIHEKARIDALCAYLAYNQARRIEIVEAIGRYTLAQVAVPKDWSEELMQLNSELA